MVYKSEDTFGDGIEKKALEYSPRSKEPTSTAEEEDPQQFHRWDFRMWKKWHWVLFFVVISAAIVIPAVTVTVLNKKKPNKYPDYAPLNYRLSDSCTHLLLLQY